MVKNNLKVFPNKDDFLLQSQMKKYCMDQEKCFVRRRVDKEKHQVEFLEMACQFVDAT